MKIKLESVWRGDASDDVFHAAAWYDHIFGFGGDDRLFGEAGKDELIGGKGHDVLRGDGAKGSFADTFVFSRSSGKDVIVDFEVAKDLISISKGVGGIKTATDTLDHARQKGSDVVIDLGDGNKITLQNVDLAALAKDPSDHFHVY